MFLELYCKLNAWLVSLEEREEGAEAIEWIAMAAVIIILLVGVYAIFQNRGEEVGNNIINQILVWISRLFQG